MSAEFLHEIDETLRTERMTSLWQKYRWVLVGALIALFAGLGAYEWWQANRIASRTAAATTYWNAVKQSGDDKKASLATIEAATKVSHEGYRTLAELRLANLYAGMDKTEQAVAAYTQVAEDKNADPALRDLATFLAAQLLMTSEPAKAEEMFSELRTKNSPFMYSAMEFQAMMAENQGNKVAALSLYTQLLENEAALPSGTRDRARLRVTALEAERNSN